MRLGVNIDHIATVRQARRGRVPDPVESALVCEQAGADSIVCHLREDRRHIQEDDVRRLRSSVTTRLNLEMSVAEPIMRVAIALKPDQATLVPERRQELTTEGGLDVVRLEPRLQRVVGRLREAGIGVSLFIDPVEVQVEAAKRSGATTIELHTGRYADAPADGRTGELAAIRRTAEHATALGLSVAAGHGLDYENTAPVTEIRAVEELNIGYSIIVRALTVGLDQAVREMAVLAHGDSVHAGRRQA